MAFIIRQNMGNGIIHLYVGTSHRVEGKKTPRQNRQYLGVLGPNNELILGKSTQEPNEEILRKLSEKGIVYNGVREIPQELKRLRRESEVVAAHVQSSRIVEVGRGVLLRRLAKSTGLLPSLEEAFGESMAGQLFCMAAYECCEGEALCRLPDWLEDTILCEKSPALSSPTMSRLLGQIGSNDMLETINRFFSAWFRANGNPRALVSDTTSISSYAEKLNLVEWGHNRDLENLPQINLNMVYARETHLPLYYRVIYGSVTDVTTIVNTGQIILNLGLKSYTFSLDRGFFHVDNLLFFHDNKLGYTMGVPLGKAGVAIRHVVDECRVKLRRFNSALIFDNTHLSHAAAPCKISVPAKNGKQARHFTVTAHVYLNRQTRADQEKAFQEILDKILSEFTRKKFTKLEEAEAWLKAIAGKENAKLFCIVPAQKKLKRAERSMCSQDGSFIIGVAERNYATAVKYFGIFMILNSDAKADGETTLRDNRSRDCQEKIFDILKNSTGNDRLRSSTDETAAGKVFVAFLAVILRKELENRLRVSGQLKNTSVNKAFDLARKFSKMRFADGKELTLEVPLKSRIVFEGVAPGLLVENGVEPGEATRSARLLAEKV